DINSREYLARLVDPFRRSGAQRIERAAARAVNAGEAKDVHGHAATMPQIEPARLGGNPPTATLPARGQLGSLVDPAADPIAIHTRRREVAQPTQALDLGDVLAMHRQRGVAGGIGRNGHEKMRDSVQRFRRQRVVAVEDLDGESRFRRLVGGSAGAADDPALGSEPAGQHPRGVAEAKAEKMRDSHDGVPAAAGTVLADNVTGSASSVSAMRLCLNRVHSQKPQETSAPTASGSRRPKCTLSEPISTAPTAGPARKIMP